MEKKFSEPIEELQFILNYLIETKQISQSSIAKTLKISDSQLVNLKKGKILNKADFYIIELKALYKHDLSMMYANIPKSAVEEIQEMHRDVIERIEGLKTFFLENIKNDN